MTAAIEIPRALRKRPRDRRGYPVGFIVFVDQAKRPHFTVSDGPRTMLAGRKKLCALCGDKLGRDIAFVGGPICFDSVFGAFSDPPMHAECARYAVRVCPYLAAPSYGRRIEDKTLSPSALKAGFAVGKLELVAEDRPQVFCLGTAAGVEMIMRPDGAPLFRPVGECLTREYWRHGRQLAGDELDAALVADGKRHQ